MTRARWKYKIATAVFALAIVRTPGARAQAAPSEPPKAPPHEPTAKELSANETVGNALMRTFGGQEFEFRTAAEAMPEDKYSFAPTTGEFKGVRTFAQQVKHVAAVNYMIGAAILEQKPPVELGGENGPDSITAKADIVKFLKDSFAYLHKAAASINEKNLQRTDPRGL